MKTFSVCWYEPQPSGPVPRIEEIEGPSKTRATQWAKAIAKERGWRFMEVREGAGAFSRPDTHMVISDI
jgi:hypothetical protein